MMRRKVMVKNPELLCFELWRGVLLGCGDCPVKDICGRKVEEETFDDGMWVACIWNGSGVILDVALYLN